jgi:hypothetical protein
MEPGAKEQVGLWAHHAHPAHAAIEKLLAKDGWTITIDLFVANCNKFSPCYASWTDESDSQVSDAFNISLWNQLECVCGASHRKTSLLFKPVRLERAVVHRAT